MSGGSTWRFNLITDPARWLVALVKRRRTLVLLSALCIFVMAPGMRWRLFDTWDESDRPALPEASPGRPIAPPARLVHLEPGCRFEGSQPPEGWSHLVIKTIPTLSTGDLDTVSAQAFETARRVRPVIVADVRQASPSAGSPFRLDRVGVGLCAPGAEPNTERVVSPTSIEGTKGPWTTKQRLILAAMARETSGAKLVAATSTFALLRTPVTFLISGAHQKIDVCYALLVNPRQGELRTLVWLDHAATDGQNVAPIVARRFASPVFDSPMDVQAGKILGSIPITWSFAIRELPPGVDLTLPPELSTLLTSTTAASARAAEIEQALIAFLQSREADAGLARGPR
ncbi:MAG: hypothetical protein ACP5XB_12720 [Isosphaeraceae bacterium]